LDIKSLKVVEVVLNESLDLSSLGGRRRVVVRAEQTAIGRVGQISVGVHPRRFLKFKVDLE
jgi:hypothetical protein